MQTHHYSQTDEAVHTVLVAYGPERVCSKWVVLYEPVCTLMCSQENAHRSVSMLEAREREPYMVPMLRSSDAVEWMVNGSSCASTSDLLADGMLASRAAASGRLSTPGDSKSKTVGRHL